MKKKSVLGLLLALVMVISTITPVSAKAKKQEEAPAKPYQVIEYFGNWHEMSLEEIPWSEITCINHAFWHVYPVTEEGVTPKTTFEAVEDGDPARTDFVVCPIDYEPDMEKGGYFDQYAKMHEKYPNVDIMISVGGWTGCGYFSEMAYTKEGRTSFINSCIETMKKYPWISGIDLDWEYPGNNLDEEQRWPDYEGDEGCPMFGTSAEDKVNFNKLVKEMRKAFDKAFGKGVKKLTTCASGSTGWTCPMQDWATVSKYVDTINIMTYDMAGGWDGTTGHHTSVFWAVNAVEYMKDLGIDASKLNIGSAFYTHAFKVSGKLNPDTIVGAEAEEDYDLSDELTWVDIAEFEAEAAALKKGKKGWHACYDEESGANYLYNDNPKSEFYKIYISYDGERSISEKIDYIKEEGLAGIIVWEITQDTKNFDRTAQLAEGLIPVVAYKIKKGDTLNSIAKACGSTAAAIAKANNISNKNMIYEGQIIFLNRNAMTSAMAAGNSYTVAAGDTLGAIAGKYKTTVKALLELNGMKKASSLKAGQIIRIK